MILSELNHENIVKLLDVVTSKTNDEYFMIFEFVEHGFFYLKKKKKNFLKKIKKRFNGIN
jgi:serine/threonine protein kinase